MTAAATPTRRIGEILIGDRTRRQLGDIAELAASIAEVGLLHPVVIHPDGTLIAGERRLEACKHLDWERVPVTVVDIAQLARGEYAENAFRKDFTPSEMVAITKKLESVERAAAKERQGSRSDRHMGKSPKGSGRALDKVARVVGRDRRTLEKAKAVVLAAEAEPKNERLAKLVQDMDRTGRVNGPFNRLKVMRQAESIRAEPPPLPNRGPYRVLTADPPWPYEKRDEDPSHRGVLPYTTMSLAQICALDVGSIAHEDSILWLWTTNAFMREAFDVLDAWGFEAKTILTWNKPKMGMGDWLRGQTEHCIMAVRGHPVVTLTNQTTSQHWPVREHSRKPEEFYDFVESLCPAPRYAYLFARNTRPNWDCHGDEVPKGDAA
jgi:N6-adenosine-specific RNA methylase IME4